MKVELDDGNYQGMIVRLTKGSAQQKSSCLKKFIFLYENARSRIYLYERRITECLELLLLMEQKDIATLTLNLLQKIIVNASPDSQIYSIIKKKLLSKVVLNLGSVDITTRKISHRCLLQYIRKSKDYDSIIACYIKTGIQQTENVHLKLKSINSLHSLIMAQPKFFVHGVLNTQILLEQIIGASYQKEHIQIRRASILCLLQILRIDGSQKTLKIICSTAQKQLYQLKIQNIELASLLQIIMKYKNSSQQRIESQIQSVPSPKFMTINEQDSKTQSALQNEQQKQKQRTDKIPQTQIKAYNDVSYAQQFLKKLQKNESWQLNEIKQFAPYLEKYLVDESIKLFSISKKIVEVIFDSQCEEQRQYYVVLVPCVVNGIGNKRFIVRKNLDKLVRQYIKNHTEIWVENFIERFAHTQNQKIKEILIQLFLHAYRTSPEFYHPTNRTFMVMEKQIKDIHSNLKWKAVDCLITVIDKQAKNEKMKQEMMSTLSPEVYNKIMRKMNKTQNSVGSNPGSVEPLSPSQRIKRKQLRKIRLTTDEPMISIQKSNQRQYRKDNVSEQKNQIVSYFDRDRKTRKSQADIEFKIRKSKQDKQSSKKLPELRRGKYSNIVSSKIEPNNESPVKKSIGQKSIMYVDKQNLPQIPQPKSELQKALIMIKDSSWNTQFESINCIRSIIENHKELISEDYFNAIITQLLQCLNNMRSGVSKIALICLGQLLRKFHKKSHPFTQQIVNTLVKKSITTSEFIQQQIKRCIVISVEELCPTKMINTLTTLKDTSKGNEIKVSILAMIDAVCKSDKIYRKEFQWIWNSLIYFHEDPSLQVKLEARRVAKGLIEAQKQWKNDINGLKPYTLQKIDKIIKGILGSNGNINNQQQNDSAWLESENKELGKLISSKVMTARYFASEYSKFEDQDKQLNSKKNFKDRSKLLSSMFASAFQYPAEFQANTNAKKYIIIALDHLDDKNPGLLLNSLISLNKSLEVFPGLIQQSLGLVYEKMLPLMDLKKVEIGQSIHKFMLKIVEKLDKAKCCRQLFKASVSSSLPLKPRIQALNQAYSIMKGEYNQEQEQKINGLESLIIKVLTKLAIQPISSQNIKDGRLRQLFNLMCRRFSNQFSEKMQANQKLWDIMSGVGDKSSEQVPKTIK